MLAERRGEFTVFVIDRDATAAKGLAETLQALGYQDSRFFPTLESAIAMARQELPHIILVDRASFGGSGAGANLESFLIDIRAMSLEVLTILMVPTTELLNSFQMVGSGLAYDAIVKPFVSSLELVQKIDRAAAQLYYQFESEQLREHFRTRGSLPESSSEISPSRATEPFQRAAKDSSGGVAAGLTDALAKFGECRDLDQTLQIFVDAVSHALGDSPVIYFRYVPSHVSFVFGYAALLPVDKFRGIGVDLKSEDPAQLAKQFAQPNSIVPLQRLVKEVFNRETFAASTYVSEGDTLGLVLVLADLSLAQNELVRDYLRLLDLAYRRNVALKDRHTLDIYDSATGIFNRRHFSKMVDDEIARSRRLLLPVSLIFINVDRIRFFNEKLGAKQADAVLKIIALIFKRTARVNDAVARLGGDEFAFLLPHTPSSGAALKAERLRRIIESTKFPLLENSQLGPVTVSLGVSEYPSLCSDAESLLRSADEAMQQVKEEGGNKVCLSTPPPGFRMDFTPQQILTSSKPGGVLQTSPKVFGGSQ